MCNRLFEQNKIYFRLIGEIKYENKTRKKNIKFLNLCSHVHLFTTQYCTNNLRVIRHTLTMWEHTKNYSRVELRAQLKKKVIPTEYKSVEIVQAQDYLENLCGT